MVCAAHGLRCGVVYGLSDGILLAHLSSNHLCLPGSAYAILAVVNDVDGGGGNTFDMIQVALSLCSVRERVVVRKRGCNVRKRETLSSVARFDAYYLDQPLVAHVGPKPLGPWRVSEWQVG